MSKFPKTIQCWQEHAVLIAHYSTEYETNIWIGVTPEHDDTNRITEHRGGDTEEGWSTNDCEWWMEDGLVYTSHYSDGVDCDGRLSTEWHGVWDQKEQTWITIESGQRDYTAESMGY